MRAEVNSVVCAAHERAIALGARLLRAADYLDDDAIQRFVRSRREQREG